MCLVVVTESIAIIGFVEREIEVCGLRECGSGKEL